MLTVPFIAHRGRPAHCHPPIHPSVHPPVHPPVYPSAPQHLCICLAYIISLAIISEVFLSQLRGSYLFTLRHLCGCPRNNKIFLHHPCDDQNQEFH